MGRGLVFRQRSCETHPHRPAVDRCETCFRRFCAECLTRLGAGDLSCSGCAAAAAPVRPGTTLRVQQGLAIALGGCVTWIAGRSAESFGIPRSHAVSLSLLSLAVLAVAVLTGGRTPSRRARSPDNATADSAALLVPLFVLVRLLPRALEGPASVVEQVARWTDQPWSVFDMGTVWGTILLVGVWHAARRVGRLQRLATSHAIADREHAYRALLRSVAVAGLAAMVVRGLTLSSPNQLGAVSRPTTQDVALPIVLYWALALTLSAQLSLSRLSAGWIAERAHVQPGLTRRWLTLGLCALALALVASALLPTSWSSSAALPPEGAARWLWLGGWPLRLAIGTVVDTIVQGVWLAVGLTWAGVSWLFNPAPADRSAPITAAGRLAPIATPRPAAPASLSAAAATPSPPNAAPLVVIAVAVLALWYLWTRRRAVVDTLRRAAGALVSLVLLVWAQVLCILAALGRLSGLPFFSRRSPVRAAPKTRPAVARATPRWLRLRALDPRRLIQYFFLSLVQRAASIGWERRQAETPYEFAHRLSARLPEHGPELSQIAEAFVHARYGAAAVTDADARRARKPWEALRGALRSRRRLFQVRRWFGLTGQ